MVVGFTGYWLHLINVCIKKKMQIAILLFRNGLTIYDLRVPTNTFYFAITFYRKSKILFISETIITLMTAFTSTFSTCDL